MKNPGRNSAYTYILVLKNNKPTLDIVKAYGVIVYKGTKKVLSFDFPPPIKSKKMRLAFIYEQLDVLEDKEKRAKARKKREAKFTKAEKAKIKKDAEKFLKDLKKFDSQLVKLKKETLKELVPLESLLVQLYEEIELLSVPPIESKVIYKSVFSDGMQRDLYLKIFEFFHDPIKFNKRTLKDLLKTIRPIYSKLLRDVWKNSKPKFRYFILRFLYKFKIRGKWITRGYSIERVEVHSFEELELMIDKHFDEMIHAFTDRREGYFTKKIIPQVAFLMGMTMETIDQASNKYRGKALSIRRKQWLKSQARLRQNERRRKTREKNKRLLGREE